MGPPRHSRVCPSSIVARPRPRTCPLSVPCPLCQRDVSRAHSHSVILLLLPTALPSVPTARCKEISVVAARSAASHPVRPRVHVHVCVQCIRVSVCPSGSLSARVSVCASVRAHASRSCRCVFPFSADSLAHCDSTALAICVPPALPHAAGHAARPIAVPAPHHLRGVLRRGRHRRRRRRQLVSPRVARRACAIVLAGPRHGLCLSCAHRCCCHRPRPRSRCPHQRRARRGRLVRRPLLLEEARCRRGSRRRPPRSPHQILFRRQVYRCVSTHHHMSASGLSAPMRACTDVSCCTCRSPLVVPLSAPLGWPASPLSLPCMVVGASRVHGAGMRPTTPCLRMVPSSHTLMVMSCDVSVLRCYGADIALCPPTHDPQSTR
jgi:hypothetical protein